jgi:hypothetical protein
MDSTDQALTEQSTTEQPKVESEQPNKDSQTFDVWWQSMTWEQLADSYKKLQGEYTKSRQELSTSKKESELSDEDKNAIAFLKKNGFQTVDDLEAMKAKTDQDANLQRIIDNNPDLQTNEAAIRDLTSSSWLAPEDVIEKYGFKSKDKLAKAKAQGDVVWSPAPKKKWVADMSMDEYEKWRKEKGIWTWQVWTFS